MLRKILTIVIAGLLIGGVCVQPASSSSKEEKLAGRTEKVRASILKIGIGTKGDITAVTLR